MSMKPTSKQSSIKTKKPTPISAKTRKRVTSPRTSDQYFDLPIVEQEKWNRVVHVISKMRSEGKSLTQASKDFDVDRRMVLSRAGSALQKTKSGRYEAKRSDRLLRVLVIPGSYGLTEVSVRGSATARKLAGYSDAVQRYLRTGDSSPLKKFKNLNLVDENRNQIKLITDLGELRNLGSAGVLSFESLYARVA
jgi:hypothetical protein